MNRTTSLNNMLKWNMNLEEQKQKQTHLCSHKTVRTDIQPISEKHHIKPMLSLCNLLFLEDAMFAVHPTKQMPVCLL